METSQKRSRRARNRKKKIKKSLKLGAKSHSPSRNLGIINGGFKKRREGIENVKTLHLRSFLQDLCQSHMSLSLNAAKDFQGHSLNKTIDLVDCEHTVDSENSSVLVMSASEVDKKDIIDLSQDIPEVYEVIDLTKPGRDSEEPTVIDISGDDLNHQQNSSPENDEISMIGMFHKPSHLVKKYESPPVIPFTNKLNNFNKLTKCSENLKKKYLKKRFILDKSHSKNVRNFKRNFGEPNKVSGNLAKIGMNVYVNSPMPLPSSGLRPIIIDGSNVAFVRSNCNFSCKRLQICINYFKEKGHKVTAFVPQFRLNSHKSDNPELLRKLEKQGDVVLTPSKKVDGRSIVPYDDRFIVQTAVLKGGIIVTRDNYNDLLRENPAWAETIKYRTLAFTWVDDVLMFPSDPLGEYGPSLEEFLKFQ